MHDSNIYDSKNRYMEYSVLKYLAFLKTADLQSFTKAAEALSCSQSAVSRMIKDLEAEFGFVDEDTDIEYVACSILSVKPVEKDGVSDSRRKDNDS